MFRNYIKIYVLLTKFMFKTQFIHTITQPNTTKHTKNELLAPVPCEENRESAKRVSKESQQREWDQAWRPFHWGKSSFLFYNHDRETLLFSPRLRSTSLLSWMDSQTVLVFVYTVKHVHWAHYSVSTLFSEYTVSTATFASQYCTVARPILINYQAFWLSCCWKSPVNVSQFVNISQCGHP